LRDSVLWLLCLQVDDSFVSAVTLYKRLFYSFKFRVVAASGAFNTSSFTIFDWSFQSVVTCRHSSRFCFGPLTLFYVRWLLTTGRMSCRPSLTPAQNIPDSLRYPPSSRGCLRAPEESGYKACLTSIHCTKRMAIHSESSEDCLLRPAGYSPSRLFDYRNFSCSRLFVYISRFFSRVEVLWFVWASEVAPSPSTTPFALSIYYRPANSSFLNSSIMNFHIF
jgi:hypothetical protein